MRRHYLISGDRPEAISMCVSQDGRARGGGIGGIEIKINRHALPCAWRSVIQSINTLNPDGVVAAGVVTLADAECKARFIVLAVPHETVIHLDFAREEK